MGLAIALVIRMTPNRTPSLYVLKTLTVPTHTTFKAESIVVGRDSSQDDLYVLTTLRVDNPLNLPIFLKDLTATLILADGQTIDTSAIEQADLGRLYATFPAVKSLASDPLLREITINPGQSSQGMVLLHFPVTKDAWVHRRTATVNVDFYHQDRQKADITRASETAPQSTASNPAK